MSKNLPPQSAAAMERTRIQAFKELRTLLSEVLASAVADEEVPEAFKNTSNWEKLIAQTESRLADGWKQRFEGVERRSAPRNLNLLPDEETEQQIMSERFVNEVSYQDRAPLDELDQQLSAMAGNDFDSHAVNPFGPSAWVEGIRGGMRQVVCTPEERDWMLERLIPLLAARMGLFYTGMNSRLAAAGFVARAPRYGGRGGRGEGGGSGGGAGGSGAAAESGAGNRANEYAPELVDSQPGGFQGYDGVGGGAGGGGESNDALDRLFGLLSARRGGPGPEAAFGAPGMGGGEGGFVPGGGHPGYGPPAGGGFGGYGPAPGGGFGGYGPAPGGGFGGYGPAPGGGFGGYGPAPGGGFPGHGPGPGGGFGGYGPAPGGGFQGYGPAPGGGFGGHGGHESAPSGDGASGFGPAQGGGFAGFGSGQGGGYPIFTPVPGAGGMPMFRPGMGAPAGAGGGGEGFQPGFGGAAPGGDGGPGFPMPAAPVVPWNQADIFSILSLLQGSYTAGPGGAAGASSMGRLQEAMSSTASQLGLAGDIQAMPGPAQDMLELVSMLFEALLDGRRLDEKARTQLARLIIPYVRVAMLDRRMFMQSSHPARRVLNLLVEAFEMASPDVPHFRTLRELGFEVIERIVEEFADDLKLFVTLEEKLATELESCRKRAELAERRAADAQAGKERRQAARDSVAAFLSQSIRGKSLPTPLLVFLAGPWQHHQNIVLLREGEAGKGVLANRLLLRDLLRCSENHDIADAEVLRSRLGDVLASSGHSSASAVDELIVELSVAFAAQSAIEATPEPTPEALVEQDRVIVERAVELAPVEAAPIEDAYLVPDAKAIELPADIIERYTQAPIGTWVDFVGDDGRITSARISWTSPISGRRILSNRRGQRMLVASPEELAEMELEGRIRPRAGESAFDQALSTIADRLEAATARV